jgi:hypothetical protein
MSAATYDLVIDQGSDFALDLAVTENGSIKNLTGYSARAQMRSSKTASSVSATFTCSIVSASGGTLKVELSNATSTAMSAGRFYYDLEIFTASNAIVKRLLEGTVTLNQEVTR